MNHSKYYPLSDIQEAFLLSGIVVLWIVLPVVTMILMLISLGISSIFFRHKRYLFIIISLTFALLAYTQESINDTDISRYYYMFQMYENIDLLNITYYDVLIDQTYFIFNPVSKFIVSLFGNVQAFSFFWIFVVYFFYFLTCENYCRYRRIKLSRNKFFLFIFLSVFGFILFTQVSETIKQAVATSMFFYGFSLFLLGKRCFCAIVIIIALGIHSSILLLLPLFFYKKCNNFIIALLVVCSVVLSFFNIMQIVTDILPMTGILGLIQAKASSYTDEMWTNSSLLRYDLLMILSISMVLMLKKSNKEYVCSKSVFIPLIYICLIIANRSVVHNYIRYVNVSYVVYAMLFIEFINTKRILTKDFKAYFELLLIVAFLVANLHMTYYRTIGGSYLSSYMDNSLLQIIGSSVFSYLSFEAT